ncbi:MAG TPA: dihydrofolate reductase family protein [Thermoleophilaceae bacterium]
MSSVIFDMSMSLDGYVRAANPRPEEPLGEGGEALHAWAMDADDAEGRAVLERGVAGTGAVICGRVTYDDSLPWWGADGPTGSARLPVFVLTHGAPSDAPAGGVYLFVTTGIEDALAQAKDAAGGRNVTIMGGPAVGNQFLRAGLVDELSIHVAPVLFGAGTQLTEALPAHIRLEPADHVSTPNATHLRYRLHGG